jgi:hypothetical protein
MSQDATCFSWKDLKNCRLGLPDMSQNFILKPFLSREVTACYVTSKGKLGVLKEQA